LSGPLFAVIQAEITNLRQPTKDVSRGGLTITFVTTVFSKIRTEEKSMHCMALHSTPKSHETKFWLIENCPVIITYL
jgi:hypothetical protein